MLWCSVQNHCGGYKVSDISERLSKTPNSHSCLTMRYLRRLTSRKSIYLIVLEVWSAWWVRAEHRLSLYKGNREWHTTSGPWGGAEIGWMYVRIVLQAYSHDPSMFLKAPKESTISQQHHLGDWASTHNRPWRHIQTRAALHSVYSLYFPNMDKNKRRPRETKNR